MHKKREWVLKEKISDNLEEQLLYNRGIKKEEADKFFNPDYERDLIDPFRILNMEKAVERIISAIKNNERIVIFGDYDADGVCSSSIFFHFFKKIDFENFHIHIPDRHLDGYGLTFDSIEEFKKQKANLIITLDCGITDFEEVKMANNYGMEVIIIDHHLPPQEDKIPPAFAIVDPKQKDDKFPFKEFCGAGLTFKTIQAIIKKINRFPGQKIKIPLGWEKWLLDLVAIATIADMVPLLGENRVLAYYGLLVLKKTKRVGLISLFRRLDLNPNNLTEEDISFLIAPRINITSRMAHANASFELLTADSFSEAEWITMRMEEMSAERKVLVEKILKESEEKLFQRGDIPPVIVLGDKNWNTAVLGLAATRLVEKYRRPVFLWGKERAEEIKGSCRGDGSINVVELMSEISPRVLCGSGGHFSAGGFSVFEEKIDVLEEEIISAYKKISKNFSSNNFLEIDAEIKLEDIDEGFYNNLQKFSPFGFANPRPIFLLRDLEIKNIKKFGNGGLHIQLDFESPDKKIQIPAIGFFLSDKKFDTLTAGKKVNLVATLEKSYFRPPAELRLRIIDLDI